MSQHDLAVATGIEQTALCAIELPGRNVTLDTIERLARALDVPPSDLLVAGKPFW